MTGCLLLINAMLSAAAPALGAQDAEAKTTGVYELRVYHCNSGKLDALHKRFKDHTMRLFEKHGMKNVAYFVIHPEDEASGSETLVYLLRHDSRDAAKASWAAFGNDPDWKKAKAESEADGTPLVARVESTYLDPVDYSPDPLADAGPKSGEPRVFQLAVCNVDDKVASYVHHLSRKHAEQVAKHGITKVFYGSSQPAGQEVKEKVAVLVAFPSKKAADEAWKALDADPEWRAAVQEAEARLGGEAPPKVTSIYLVPTEYSPKR